MVGGGGLRQGEVGGDTQGEAHGLSPCCPSEPTLVGDVGGEMNGAAAGLRGCDADRDGGTYTALSGLLRRPGATALRAGAGAAEAAGRLQSPRKLGGLSPPGLRLWGLVPPCGWVVELELACRDSSLVGCCSPISSKSLSRDPLPAPPATSPMPSPIVGKACSQVVRPRVKSISCCWKHTTVLLSASSPTLKVANSGKPVSTTCMW